MARKCSCQICKTKGSTDVFYKVTDDKGKNKYYCSKEEYDSFMKDKENREYLIKYIAVDVFNYSEGQIIPPILLKRIKELNVFYDYEVIYECFKDSKDNIKYWIENKGFSSEYGMVSYIMKIIESNINDIYNKWKYKKSQEQKKKNNDLNLEIINEITEIKQVKKSNNILDFLDEEDV
ncbi:hypothetical protein [Priestia flexa]|uniref:hypothetical protein n=1 Tax=Priestia flexa TaxID=86664 RepID=UPI0004733387|nr:hypothetical protein [Priestia flexa]